MPSTFASLIYPVADRFIAFGKETAGASGTAVAPTVTVPMNKFDPVDKLMYYEDDAWRHSPAGLYNMVQGVISSEISMGGPMFADTIGYPLAGILGDYYQSVNTGAAGTATTLNGGVSVGATAVTLTSATGFTNTTVFAVGALGTKAEEIRQGNSLVGSTLYFTPPLYQAHLTGAAVTPYSTVNLTINHNFALLCSGAGMGGFSNCQPPTYTLVDYTGLPATYGARQYAYGVPTEVTLTGTATGAVMWEAKYLALGSQIVSATPTSNPSGVIPQAAWNSTVTLGGTQEYNGTEWKLTLTRKAEPVFTDSGQQDPFAIPRGVFTAGLSFDFDPAVDESEFLFFRNNTQPTSSIVASNGLAGTSAASLTITSQVTAFDTGNLTDNREAFGFAETAKLVSNTTNIGPSGGYGPCVITLQNAVVAY